MAKVVKTNYLNKYGNITGYGSKYWKPGLDVDLKIGDPVTTPKAGKVVIAGEKGGFGNQVAVEDERGNVIMLSHLDKINAKVGQILKAGEFVGEGGNTGTTYSPGGGDGSHVDITVKKKDGSFLTPEQVETYVKYEPKENVKPKIDIMSMRNLNEKIETLRKKGKSDTYILNTMAKVDPNFAKKVEAGRKIIEKGNRDNLQNDRDLLNYINKVVTGKTLTVPSMPTRQQHDEDFAGMRKNIEELKEIEEKEKEERPSFTERIKGVGEQIKEGFGRQMESTKKFLGRVGESVGAEAVGDQTKLETGAQIMGESALALGSSFGNVLETIVKSANELSGDRLGEAVEPLKPGLEELKEDVSYIVQEGPKNVLENIRQEDPEKAEQVEQFFTNPRTQRNLRVLLGMAEMFGFSKAKPAVEAGERAVVTGVKEGVKAGVKTVDDFEVWMAKQVKDRGLGKNAGLVDDITPTPKPAGAAGEATTPSKIAGKVTTPSKIADELFPRTAEAAKTAPEVTFTQKLVGMTPSNKRRITENPDDFIEYLDVAKAREKNDLLDSAMTHASNKVTEVKNILNQKLNDTGSELGKFRQKLATVKAPIDDIQKVIDKFDAELAKKGMKVDGLGKLIVSKGRETSLTERDIKALTTIRNDLIKLKGDPTLQRIMDNRIKIDKNINFAKEAKEVSSEVDPISRAVRFELKSINETIIGKSEAAKLAKYSALNDLLYDLNKLTSKGANNEFLLKRVLTERSRLPKETLAAIKEETGIDLMNDAVFAQLVTELVGGADVKSGFRKEIKKAGVDVVSMLNPKVNVLQSLAGTAAEIFIKAEKEYIRAAQQGAKKNIFEKAEDGIKDIPETLKKAIKSEEGFFVIPDVPDNLINTAKKYKNVDEFINGVKKADLENSMAHRPNKSGHGFNIDSNGNAPDFYTNPEYFGSMNNNTYKESVIALMNIKNNPNAEITIYRATPKGELRYGDWITLSKDYAKQEASTEGVPIIAVKVKAKDIQFAGDDINEFGYFPTDETLREIFNKSR